MKLTGEKYKMQMRNLLIILNDKYPEISGLSNKERYLKTIQKSELESLFQSIYKKRNQLLFEYLTEN